MLTNARRDILDDLGFDFKVMWEGNIVNFNLCDWKNIYLYRAVWYSIVHSAIKSFHGLLSLIMMMMMMMMMITDTRILQKKIAGFRAELSYIFNC